MIIKIVKSLINHTLIFSSTLLNKVVMEVTVPHIFGSNRTRSDRKLNFTK